MEEKFRTIKVVTEGDIQIIPRLPPSSSYSVKKREVMTIKPSETIEIAYDSRVEKKNVVTIDTDSLVDMERLNPTVIPQVFHKKEEAMLAEETKSSFSFSDGHAHRNEIIVKNEIHKEISSTILVEKQLSQAPLPIHIDFPKSIHTANESSSDPPSQSTESIKIDPFSNLPIAERIEFVIEYNLTKPTNTSNARIEQFSHLVHNLTDAVTTISSYNFSTYIPSHEILQPQLYYGIVCLCVVIVLVRLWFGRWWSANTTTTGSSSGCSTQQHHSKLTTYTQVKKANGHVLTSTSMQMYSSSKTQQKQQKQQQPAMMVMPWEKKDSIEHMLLEVSDRTLFTSPSSYIPTSSSSSSLWLVSKELKKSMRQQAEYHRHAYEWRVFLTTLASYNASDWRQIGRSNRNNNNNKQTEEEENALNGLYLQITKLHLRLDHTIQTLEPLQPSSSTATSTSTALSYLQEEDRLCNQLDVLSQQYQILQIACNLIYTMQQYQHPHTSSSSSLTPPNANANQYLTYQLLRDSKKQEYMQYEQTWHTFIHTKALAQDHFQQCLYRYMQLILIFTVLAFIMCTLDCFVCTNTFSYSQLTSLPTVLGQCIYKAIDYLCTFCYEYFWYPIIDCYWVHSTGRKVLLMHEQQQQQVYTSNGNGNGNGDSMEQAMLWQEFEELFQSYNTTSTSPTTTTASTPSTTNMMRSMTISLLQTLHPYLTFFSTTNTNTNTNTIGGYQPTNTIEAMYSILLMLIIPMLFRTFRISTYLDQMFYTITYPPLYIKCLFSLAFLYVYSLPGRILDYLLSYCIGNDDQKVIKSFRIWCKSGCHLYMFSGLIQKALCGVLQPILLWIGYVWMIYEVISWYWEYIENTTSYAIEEDANKKDRKMRRTGRHAIYHGLHQLQRIVQYWREYLTFTIIIFSSFILVQHWLLQ